MAPDHVFLCVAAGRLGNCSKQFPGQDHEARSKGGVVPRGHGSRARAGRELSQWLDHEGPRRSHLALSRRCPVLFRLCRCVGKT
jgi:hypothetical protein